LTLVGAYLGQTDDISWNELSKLQLWMLNYGIGSLGSYQEFSIAFHISLFGQIHTQFERDEANKINPLELHCEDYSMHA
jgi:hypothetical protein